MVAPRSFRDGMAEGSAASSLRSSCWSSRTGPGHDGRHRPDLLLHSVLRGRSEPHPRGTCRCRGGRSGGSGHPDVGSYPVQRIIAFLNPWRTRKEPAYHTIKGLEALAAGGLFGNRAWQRQDHGPKRLQRLHLLGHRPAAGDVRRRGRHSVSSLIFAIAGCRTALRAPDTFGA